MYDTEEFVYKIVYQGKTILKTKDIHKLNIFASLLKQIDQEGLNLESEEIQRLAVIIYKIYLEDIANIDPGYLTEQVFRLYLIHELEWLENSSPKQVLLDIYDNEF